jgi:hypothetical protein
MRWLDDGVPLTLLCDLASTTDPQSQAINLAERPPGDEDFYLDAPAASSQMAAS